MKKPLEVPEKCQSCGICIGPSFIETLTYKVGSFAVCGWCRMKLIQHGHIELDGRRQVKGQGTVCRWLYPDGSVNLMRFITVKYPEPDVLFLPLNRPLPEDFEFGENKETEIID